MYKHRQMCPTCEGRKRIVCCSVDDQTNCHTLDCPTCNGKGYLVDQKQFIGKVILSVAIAGALLGIIIGAALTGFLV